MRGFSPRRPTANHRRRPDRSRRFRLEILSPPISTTSQPRPGRHRLNPTRRTILRSARSGEPRIGGASGRSCGRPDDGCSLPAAMFDPSGPDGTNANIDPPTDRESTRRHHSSSSGDGTRETLPAELHSPRGAGTPPFGGRGRENLAEPDRERAGARPLHRRWVVRLERVPGRPFLGRQPVASRVATRNRCRHKLLGHRREKSAHGVRLRCRARPGAPRSAPLIELECPFAKAQTATAP